MQPLVEAFGYRNVRVDGYEADDVIATLAAARAREGHRRDGRDRRPRHVPARSSRRRARDGHEPRHHRDEGLRPPGGDRPLRHPAGADPRLLRPEGRHLGQHPGRPRHRRQDGVASCSSEFGDLETVLERRRDLRRQAQGEPDQPRRRRAHVEAARDARPRRGGRDRPRGDASPHEPDRSRLREMFREFELREPLRRLEEALGRGRGGARAAAAATTRRGARRPTAAAGRSWRSSTASCATLAAERPGEPDEPAAGRSSIPARARRRPLRFAAYAGGERCCRARPRRSPRSRWRWGERPLVAHDWKTIAAPEEPCDAPPLEHDTLVAAYLLDPAGRAYPLDELPSARASARAIEGRRTGWPSAPWSRAPSPSASASELEERGPHAPVPRGRAAARRRAGGHGARRRQARHRGASRRSPAAWRSRSRTLEREICELAGEEFTIGSPQQLGGDPVRQARPVEEAPRQDRLLDRRARAPGDPRRAPDHPEDRGLARALQAEVHLPRRAAAAGGRAQPPAHHLQPDGHHHGPPVEHRPEPPEHPDPDRARPRDPRRASWPRRATS